MSECLQFVYLHDEMLKLAWRIFFLGVPSYCLPCFGVRADPSRITTLDSSPDVALPSIVLDEDVSHVPHNIFRPICECWQNSSNAELGLALLVCMCTTKQYVFKGTQGQSDPKNEFAQLCKSHFCLSVVLGLLECTATLAGLHWGLDFILA